MSETVVKEGEEMSFTHSEQEQAQSPRIHVGSSVEDFTAQLRDCDVLLFDKLSPLNRLVQWGDNRPAGHAAVWHGNGIYEATIKPLKDGTSQGGVFLTPFDELMSLTAADQRGSVALVRTVTALRHRRISEESRQLIADFMERTRKADFGVHDMVLLAPFALERSNVTSSGGSQEFLQHIVQACAYFAKKRSAADGRQKLFCSQLVYQAFQSAGLTIEIQDPLYTRYHTRQHLPVFRGGALGSSGLQGIGGFDGEPDGLHPASAAALADYRTVFENNVLEDMPGADEDDVDDPAAIPSTPSPALTLRGLLPKDAGVHRRPRRKPELGDMVTPGDFWASPSLQPVAVLHRPAGL